MLIIFLRVALSCLCLYVKKKTFAHKGTKHNEFH